MKDPSVEYIDTIIDFFYQRAIVKSMFDKMTKVVYTSVLKVKKKYKNKSVNFSRHQMTYLI